MVTTRKLSRAQIARIVGNDPEAIRAFENLIDAGNEVTATAFNLLVARVSSLEGRVDGLEDDIVAINIILADYGVRISDLETEVDGLLAREGISVIRTVTVDDSPTSADNVILADATAGAIIISLPTAASMEGRRLEIKKIDATVNAVTLTPDGAETIDGSATAPITTPFASLTIISNGTEWFIL